MSITLIVEEGTGLANANTLISLDFANAYHEAHGNSDWDYEALSPQPSPDETDDDQYKSAIIRGSAWVSNYFIPQYNGKRLKGRAQAFMWPQTGATDVEGEEVADDSVPIEIQNASAEAALREFVSPGSLSPDYVGTERVTQEVLGPLSVSYADPVYGAADSQPVITKIEQIVAPLLGGGMRSTRLFGETTRI